MRFWTAMGTNIGRRRYWTYSFGFNIGGAVEYEDFARKCVGNENTASSVVMVDPEEHEIDALGNAVVIPYNDHVYVALTPCGIDRTIHHANRQETFAHWSRDQWAKDKKDSVIFVKDGKQVSGCTGCKNILVRTSGGCIPGLVNCSQRFFPDEATITLPPKSLFMPVNKCCSREAFEGYRLSNVNTDASPDKPCVSTVYPGAAKKGATTKMFADLACKLCMFCDNGRCVTGSRHSHKWCNGPFFSSDIPKPSNSMREAVRYMGIPILLDAYKQAAEEHKWPVRNWKVDPEIRIGCLFYKCAGLDGLQLIRTKGYNRDHGQLTEPGNFQTIKKAFNLSVNVPDKPASMLERLVCWGLENGLYSGGAYMTRYGASPSLVGVTYCDGSDDAYIDYTWTRHSFSNRARSVQQLVGLYPSFVYQGDTKRSSFLKLILSSRGPDKSAQVKRCISYILNEMKEADSKGLPIPDVYDLEKQYIERHTKGVRTWCTEQAND